MVFNKNKSDQVLTMYKEYTGFRHMEELLLLLFLYINI